MAQVKIEIDPETWNEDAVREIRGINPSKRGVRPRIIDTSIHCGTLTRDKIIEELTLAGVKIKHITKRDKTGHEVGLSVEKMLNRVKYTEGSDLPRLPQRCISGRGWF